MCSNIHETLPCIAVIQAPDMMHLKEKYIEIMLKKLKLIYCLIKKKIFIIN